MSILLYANNLCNNTEREREREREMTRETERERGGVESETERVYSS